MRLYLGRRVDEEWGEDFYELGTAKKDWDRERGFNKSLVLELCAELFQKYTKIRLKPGQVVRVKKIIFETE